MSRITCMAYFYAFEGKESTHLKNSLSQNGGDETESGKHERSGCPFAGVRANLQPQTAGKRLGRTALPVYGGGEARKTPV